MDKLLKFCVIGAGNYGTAIGNVCSRIPNSSVVFWARNKEVVDSINLKN